MVTCKLIDSLQKYRQKLDPDSKVGVCLLVYFYLSGLNGFPVEVAAISVGARCFRKTNKCSPYYIR